MTPFICIETPFIRILIDTLKNIKIITYILLMYPWRKTSFRLQLPVQNTYVEKKPISQKKIWWKEGNHGTKDKVKNIQQKKKKSD